MRSYEPDEVECAIAQAAAVVGEWWTLLILRDVAGGINRFDELQAGLAISRKVLSERLTALISDVCSRGAPTRRARLATSTSRPSTITSLTRSAASVLQSAASITASLPGTFQQQLPAWPDGS